MKYALVVLGFVKAVMVADSAFVVTSGSDAAALYGYPSGTWVEVVGAVGRGDVYADGVFTARRYGSSVSASSPATSTTAGQTLSIDVDGDGAQQIYLATSGTAAEVAVDIQTKVRALTALYPGNAEALASFGCFYHPVEGKYYLNSTRFGAAHSVTVTSGTAAESLKLGVAQGGTEIAGAGE